jgi:hypothetical protein
LQLADSTLLLTQDVDRAGFYPSGTIAPSVTHAVTMELEKARAASLGVRITTALDNDQYERWSWEACSKMSSQPLLSPPDQFGYMEDPVFQVMIVTYLGQPCPIMAPLVGRYFGKNGAQLDRFGANLASSPLPGRGHRLLHNQVQSLLKSMMKLAGISAEKEAVNFLLDKVGNPYITRYINHCFKCKA